MVDGDMMHGKRARARWHVVALMMLAAIALTLVSYGLQDSRAAIPVEQVSCGAQSQSVFVILRGESEAVDSYTECMLDRATDLATATPTSVYEHGLGEPMALH